MMSAGRNRLWSVLLSLVVLLPTLAVGLSASAEAPVTYGTQTYESFEAQKYPSSDAGIAGNGDGREVSADYNHTPGGGKAIKLTLNGYKSSAETPQTVALGEDGTRLVLNKGTRYTVSVWLYSETAISIKYRVASVKNPNDVSWGVRTLEKEIVTDLPAGEWTQLVTDLTLSGVSGQDTAYLTVGATFSASTSATGAIYVDDMRVQEYVDFSGLDYQSYESYEAKKHAASSSGIAGNGDGREVSADYNHTPGGFHAIKLTSKGAKSLHETPQTVVLTPDGAWQTFEKGKTYVVSAWLYTATTTQVKYRIASVKNANDVTWGVRAMEKETVLDLPAGVWTPVETKITIVGVSGQDTAYLTLGATFATATSDTGYFYVDDVKVTEYVPASPVTTFKGGMLYTGGKVGSLNGKLGSAVYNHNGNPCTALRVAADYVCVDNDPAKVLYDNTTWTVVGRGVLLNYSFNTGEGGIPTLDDATSYKMKNYVTGDQLQSYWRLENNTVRYSVLVKNMNKEMATGLQLTWRSYMVITDGINEVTVYGDTVSDVTAQMLYEAATNQGHSVTWFTEE